MNRGSFFAGVKSTPKTLGRGSAARLTIKAMAPDAIKVPLKLAPIIAE